MIDTNATFGEERTTPFSLRLFLLKYLRYWYWFVLALLLTMGAAYVYLRYATPIYQVSAVLMIKNQNKSTEADDLLKAIESQSANKIVENEIEVLKSRTLIQRMVDDLNLTVAYLRPGAVRDEEEIYGTSPVQVRAGVLTPLAYQDPFSIRVLNRQQYEILDKEGQKKRVFTFDQNARSEYGTFLVHLNDSLYRPNDTPVKIVFRDKESVVQYYKNAIRVDLLNPKSTVLRLTLEEALPAKGQAVLSKLLEAYAYSALTDKNREATNTLDFINKRLSLITGELGDVERNVESYKSAQGITDLSAEGNLFLEAVKDNDSKLNDVGIQLKVLEGVETYLKNSQSGLAPATLAVSDPVLTGLLEKLSELETQREKYARTVQPDNPLLQTINAQIATTKGAIRENVGNQRQNLIVTRNSLQRLNNRFESSIRTIPRKEREFVDIKRQQGIKQDLYLLLLKKKEETAISYASTVTDSRIVDNPYPTPYPIKPNRTNIYLVAFLAGLLIPVGLIAVRDLLNDKIQSRNDIENETGLVVFGEVMRKPKTMDNNIVDPNTNSVIAEQFKILRANLQYALGAGANDSDDGRVLLITSSIGGEGKSFVSINLAASLAMLNKTVVILELDLRKPKIATYLGVTKARTMGISNYLIGQGSIGDIIKPTNVHPGLYVVPSGPIPPNPSELLSAERIATLLNALRKQFDYVIVDTPPVGLVVDATLLGPYVDSAFYIVRHEYTPRTYLRLLTNLRASGKFKSLNVIFNGVDYRNSSEYGYGYGYGYNYGYGKSKA